MSVADIDGSNVSGRDYFHNLWMDRLEHEKEKVGGGVSDSVPDSENWYIMRIDGSIDDTLETLSGNGIPCHELSGKTSYKKSVAFPAKFTEEVFGVLCGGSREYKLENTNVPNLFLLVMRGDEVYTSNPEDLHLEGWEYISPVIEWAWDNYGVRVDVDNPHGKVKTPEGVINDNFLHVHFWSVPEQSSKRTFDSVYGLPLAVAQRDGFSPSGVGDSITDDRGNVVAEYIDGNLYVLFDLPHAKGEVVTNMFKQIMKSYFDTVRRVIYGVETSIRENVSPTSRDLFIKSCNKLYERNVAEMSSKKASCERTLEECSKKIVSLTREKEIIEAKIAPLEKSLESRKEIAGKEYDVLRSSEHVTDVIVEDNVIQVFTDTVMIPYNGHIYDIGKFRIDIYTDGSNGGVKAFNINRSRLGGRLHHPHVKDDGECCLGNIKEGIGKLIAECQYAVLAQMMIAYLHSYNPESTYAGIGEWS